jgi:hypothetical protein
VTCCDNDEIQSVIAIFLYSCLGEELFDILDDQDLSVFIFSSHSLEFRPLNGDNLRLGLYRFFWNPGVECVYKHVPAFQSHCILERSNMEAKYGNLA